MVADGVLGQMPEPFVVEGGVTGGDRRHVGLDARLVLRRRRDRARFARPAYAPFWRLWAEEGWLSLGHARDFDWRHVQAARL